MSKTVEHFSPSLTHFPIMDQTQPTLGFTGGDVKSWQTKARRKLRQLVKMPKVKKVPLNVRSLWKRDHKHGTIEKILFEVEPNCTAMAYVCLPKNVKPPYNFFICLQGHTTGAHHSIGVDFFDNSKPIKVKGDRDFGITCMKKGIAAICLEQRSFGERGEAHLPGRGKHTCQDAAMRALMLGRTLLGERIFDVDRTLDYLKTRKDVNWPHVGIMGNSGGGTLSLFSAALLPRLKYAMPSCYFCTFYHSIMSLYHCTDNYVPDLYNHMEMADIMGLFAPNPVVIVAGKTDPIFPHHAVRKAFKHLKKIYRAAGAGNRVHLVTGNGGHRFYAKPGWDKMLAEMHKELKKK